MKDTEILTKKTDYSNDPAVTTEYFEGNGIYTETVTVGETTWVDKFCIATNLDDSVNSGLDFSKTASGSAIQVINKVEVTEVDGDDELFKVSGFVNDVYEFSAKYYFDDDFNNMTLITVVGEEILYVFDKENVDNYSILRATEEGGTLERYEDGVLVEHKYFDAEGKLIQTDDEQAS